MRTFKLVVGLLALIIAGHAGAQAPQQDTHEWVFKNGLKLVVKEDHRAPVVVSQIWYKVGSSYEHGGITGISHVLEHMMFKGTRKHPAGEFSRIISENGGRENAFTGQDYTAYFQQLERSRLPVSFELEADRMRNLLLPEEEFAKEIRVVMEERRLRTEDDPRSLTHEQFNAAAYVASPYHHPIIGWMDDLENLTVEDLKKWYQMWYAPNNATVVVVGDVVPKEVYQLAKRYFSGLKPSKLADTKPRREVTQMGQRRVTVRAPAELPYLIMGYKVPSRPSAPDSWEPYALEVAAAILDGGDSARLASDVVRRQQVAVNAGAGYDMTSRLETLFLLDGVPSTGRTVPEVERALLEQVSRLQNEPVTKTELERIKTQVLAGKTYERDSVFYQAMQIGISETTGLDWRDLDEYLDRIRAVTPDQVQEVAKKYLIDDRLTVAILEPLPLATGASMTGGHGGGHGH